VSLVSVLRSGVRSVLRSGLNPSDGGGGDPLAGVSRDATSTVYAPATAGEWATVMTVAGIASGGPSSLRLCQEPSGNLADSIDSVVMTVTGVSWLYQQAVAGWTRTALTVLDGLASHNAQNTTTAPDLSTTSVLKLMYVRTPLVTPLAVRRIARLNATGLTATISSGGVVQCITSGVGGSTVNGTSNPCGGTVRPFVMQADRTNLVARVCTDQDRITGTVGTYATIAEGMGSSAGTSADCGYLYDVTFTGAAAELSAAQIKTLLQTLNWTIPWT
jgi:hypothetical protein